MSEFQDYMIQSQITEENNKKRVEELKGKTARQVLEEAFEDKQDSKYLYNVLRILKGSELDDEMVLAQLLLQVIDQVDIERNKLMETAMKNVNAFGVMKL